MKKLLLTITTLGTLSVSAHGPPEIVRCTLTPQGTTMSAFIVVEGGDPPFSYYTSRGIGKHFAPKVHNQGPTSSRRVYIKDITGISKTKVLIIVEDSSHMTDYKEIEFSPHLFKNSL